jgi:hypothetical protein
MKKRSGNSALSLVIIGCTIFLWYTITNDPGARPLAIATIDTIQPQEVSPTSTLPQPTPTPIYSNPTPFPPDPPVGKCDPSYPTVCIPPYPPDLDCGEISYRRFKVVGSDPHGFDGDNDGVGCERR